MAVISASGLQAAALRRRGVAAATVGLLVLEGMDLGVPLHRGQGDGSGEADVGQANGEGCDGAQRGPS